GAAPHGAGAATAPSPTGGSASPRSAGGRISRSAGPVPASGPRPVDASAGRPRSGAAAPAAPSAGIRADRPSPARGRSETIRPVAARREPARVLLGPTPRCPGCGAGHSTPEYRWEPPLERLTDPFPADRRVGGRGRGAPGGAAAEALRRG